MNKSKLALRAAGAGILSCALLASPTTPLFLNKSDPYATLRQPLSATQKMSSLARSIMRIESAKAVDLSKPMDSLRSAVGFVMGYGSRAAYIEFACGGTDPGTGLECDGPPENGLVGKMAEILNTVPAALGAAGVASCAAIPSSGTASITLNGEAATLTYGTPTQSIPAAWDDGGTAFTKRLEFAVTVATQTTNFAAEFACGAEGILLAINMNVGDHAPGFTRPINVWVGKKDDKRVADIYVSEVNSSDHVRGAYAYHLEVDEDTMTYQLVGTAGTWFSTGSTKGMDRIHIHGNYSTNEASVYLIRGIKTGLGSGSGEYQDAAGHAALTGGSDASVGTGASFALNTATGTANNATYSFQGCVDFDNPTTDPTSTTLCTGLALNAVDAPVIHSAGNFGSGWVLQEMHDRLVGLPAI